MVLKSTRSLNLSAFGGFVGSLYVVLFISLMALFGRMKIGSCGCFVCVPPQ